MNERIHRYLDGELAGEELTAHERREAEAYEDAVRRISAAAAGEPAPDVTAMVMDRIAAEARPRSADLDATAPSLSRFLSDLGGWLWSPRPVRLRPAYGLAAAAAIGALMVFAPAQGPAPIPEVTAGDSVAPEVRVFVQFRLEAPEASMVQLAGSFTGWEPEYSLHRTSTGVWSLLVPLDPGVHEYSFVVDGSEWQPDPTGPRVSDGFGGENSRVTVLPPDSGAL